MNYPPNFSSYTVSSKNKFKTIVLLRSNKEKIKTLFECAVPTDLKQINKIYGITKFRSWKKWEKRSFFFMKTGF